MATLKITNIEKLGIITKQDILYLNDGSLIIYDGTYWRHIIPGKDMHAITDLSKYIEKKKLV